jgi:hypothetical protein
MTQPLSDVGRKPTARAVVVEVPEEGPPIVCNLAAAMFSFVLLTALEFLSSQYFGDLSATLDDAWMLLLELLPFGMLLDAALGSMLLLVLAIAVQLFQRARRFPDWLPLVLAWPAAFILVAPSALEHADDWAPWLLLGGLAAFVFCCHWLAFMLARDAWD